MEGAVSRLPSGTVTFLFTDIERSTESAAALGDERYAEALQIHRDLLRPAFEKHNGVEVGTEGDAFFVAFGRAGDAINSAIDGQHALETYVWPGETRLRVRIGIHTGEALVRGDDYVGHEVHRAKRIADAGHGGQILLSQTTADLVGIPTKDLGPHRLKDLSEPQRLHQVLADDLPSEFPRLRTLEAVPHNLPVQLTSFVGREVELEDVRRLLEATRLLTITGAGGCGKTRLALQLGAEVLDSFPHGVWLADLAPLTDAAAVPQTVADAVGVPQGHADDAAAQQPVEERLLVHLKGRTALVILDNCEHLIGACAALATTLLQKCEDVRVVVTSREPLGIAGETSWRLPSLALLDSKDATPEKLADAEATRLFCDRAGQAVPTFEPTQEDARAIVDICTRLDGIPLAIELAAARVRVLSCAEIDKRLDDRFRLLTGGSRMAMPRQQTLRATVDWSHDLLTLEQQVLLRRLSVFAGGFTLDAAETICADGLLPADDVLDHLTALVDRSLVLSDQKRNRYRLLDTVRHYAREKLVDSGEGADVRRRHMEHFADLSIRGGSELNGPHARGWLGALEAELANIRQAFEWALTEDPGLALRIVAELLEFWNMSVRRREAGRWAEVALAATDETPSSDRIRAIRVMARGTDDLSRALELAREIGDKPQTAALLQNLGGPAVVLGLRDRGLPMLHESLDLAREIGDEVVEARTLASLGTAAALAGNTVEARDYHEQSLQILRRRGDEHGQATMEASIGQAARIAGDWDTARKHIERQLEIGTEFGCRSCMNGSQLTLAWLARGRGDHEQAIAYAANAARSALEDRQLGNLYFLSGTFAMVAYDTGDHDRAARLLGAAQTFREAVGFVVGGAAGEAEQRRIRRVRDALGDSAFEAAYSAGRAMSVDEVVAYALEVAQ